MGRIGHFSRQLIILINERFCSIWKLNLCHSINVLKGVNHTVEKFVAFTKSASRCTDAKLPGANEFTNER